VRLDWAVLGLYRLAPGVLDALKIITPETPIRWHRAGYGWQQAPRRASL
jgi:hypothetical protein